MKIRNVKLGKWIIFWLKINSRRAILISLIITKQLNEQLKYIFSFYNLLLTASASHISILFCFPKHPVKFNQTADKHDILVSVTQNHTLVRVISALALTHCDQSVICKRFQGLSSIYKTNSVIQHCQFWDGAGESHTVNLPSTSNQTPFIPACKLFVHTTCKHYDIMIDDGANNTPIWRKTIGIVKYLFRQN